MNPRLWNASEKEKEGKGKARMSENEKDGLPGTGISPSWVANGILRRAFDEGMDVTPMKLQRLMFFVACLFQRETRCRLLTEQFQPWKYGPVCGSAYDEFRSFGGNPITEYAKDSKGNAYAVDESSSAAFSSALDDVWRHMKALPAVSLSRIACRSGSAWSKAVQERNAFVSDADMADDHTFDTYLEA